MSNSYYNDGLTLGQLIDELKELPTAANIEFDFGSANVTTLDSYRGYYDSLALGYDGAYGSKLKTVGELLEDCEQAIGKVYEGWKGGDYCMDRDTNVFVANRGCTSKTSIKSIRQKYDDWYVIETQEEDL